MLTRGARAHKLFNHLIPPPSDDNVASNQISDCKKKKKKIIIRSRRPSVQPAHRLLWPATRHSLPHAFTASAISSH